MVQSPRVAFFGHRKPVGGGEAAKSNVAARLSSNDSLDFAQVTSLGKSHARAPRSYACVLSVMGAQFVVVPLAAPQTPRDSGALVPRITAGALRA